MPKVAMGIRGGGPETGPIGDLGAVGNVARVSKGATAAPQELTSFSVKRGDNGGIVVSEIYEKKAPAGRRPSSFLGGGDFKENPFSPDDGAAATTHITGLLNQMGVTTPAPAPAAPVAGISGPRGAAVRGPAGGAARVGPPMGDMGD